MPLEAKSVDKLARIQVLLMDGSAHVSELLREIFVKLGFNNVLVVNDGFEGIQAIKRQPIHLIFTDWELRVRKRNPLDDGSQPPKEEDLLPLSGTEFVRRLRQSPKSPNPFVPIVMVVNQNSPEVYAAARDAGVNEIVSKPIKADELCKRITDLIDDKRHFITADTYKGPCRRRENKPLPAGKAERRIRQVRLIRRMEKV
jgi:two-component system, chemotaxis family, chemotaxis protein CheY